MSQTRREIVFNARDNGVSSMMSKLRQSANEMGRDLVREALANSSNAQDAIKYYEQQIRLIEKKNKLQQQGSRMGLDNRYQSALNQPGANKSQITQKYKEQLVQLQKGGREDQIQVDLLRELIETVKLTSGQEIKSDGKNSMRESSGIERALLGGAGGEFLELSDKLSSEKSGGRNKTSSGVGVGERVANAASGLRNMAGSGDAMGMAGSAAGMLGKANPWVMAAMAIVGLGTMGHAARAKREMPAREFAGLSGMSISSIIDKQIGTSDMGEYGAIDLNVSRNDFLSKHVPSAIRSAGTSRFAGQRAMRHLEIEKGMALGEGTAGQIERLTRVLEGSTTAQTTAAKVYSSMYGTGALGQGNQDMARMQDIMQGFLQFQDSQFMRAGVTDSTTTFGMMRKLQQMGGRFSRDDYAMDTIGRLNTGLSQAGTAEAQAIKFDVLRRANPNKSFFELQMEMEKGVNSKGYMSGIFDFVKGTGGNLNSQSIMMDQLTGGSMRKSDIWDLLSGNKSLDDINKEQQLRDPNFKGKALNASSEAQMQVDFMKEAVDDAMNKMGEWVGEVIESVKGIGTKIDTAVKKIENIDFNPFD